MASPFKSDAERKAAFASMNNPRAGVSLKKKSWRIKDTRSKRAIATDKGIQAERTTSDVPTWADNKNEMDLKGYDDLHSKRKKPPLSEADLAKIDKRLEPVTQKDLDKIDKNLERMIARAQSKEPNEGHRHHKLMPADLRAKLPALYSQEEAKDPMVYAKFFSPYSQYTLLITEFDGKDTLFGYGGVDPQFYELGYSSLKEIAEADRNGIPLIERDMGFTPKKLSEACKAEGMETPLYMSSQEKEEEPERNPDYDKCVSKDAETAAYATREAYQTKTDWEGTGFLDVNEIKPAINVVKSYNEFRASKTIKLLEPYQGKVKVKFARESSPVVYVKSSDKAVLDEIASKFTGYADEVNFATSYHIDKNPSKDTLRLWFD